ncbi:hypothetical protein [Niveibacterium terrae]|uniref:hypothetical protein n=1 Tax=Niveibacterium terrae TaxID=3373598 RepID=UPI003A8E680F
MRRPGHRIVPALELGDEVGAVKIRMVDRFPGQDDLREFVIREWVEELMHGKSCFAEEAGKPLLPVSGDLPGLIAPFDAVIGNREVVLGNPAEILEPELVLDRDDELATRFERGLRHFEAGNKGVLRVDIDRRIFEHADQCDDVVLRLELDILEV